MMGLGSSVTLEVQKEGITEEQPNTTCSLESNVTPSGISQVNTRGDTSQSITTQSSSSSSESSEEDTQSEGLQLRRSKRGNVPKRHFEVEGKSCDFAMFAVESAIGKEVWKKVMQEEINSIEKNGTWKLHSDGTIQRHKARLVARGYVQEQGIDFEETFSPVAKFETVRIILAFAAMMRWTVFQFDVKSAFLNGELKEVVYVQQPEFFEVPGDEHKAYKLAKALYGVKQAPRAWYSKIDEFFHLNGFERSPNEPTLYVKREGAEDIMFVSLFMHYPSKHHYGAAKRILRYIAGTTTYGIWYLRKEKFELVGYCDSDWAGAKDDMKSTSRNCFMFGSGVVTWASKKEATIALSSTEAEYISAATAACQAVRLRRVLEDLNQTQERRSVTFCNNRSAVAMTRNPVLHARTKHIDIKPGQLILTISRRDLIEISDLGPRKNLGSKSR
ncbi:retrovirus-related pol polyprotein from transposon TNT 1-94, partial [Tanacetum coccineum]